VRSKSVSELAYKRNSMSSIVGSVTLAPKPESFLKSSLAKRASSNHELFNDFTKISSRQQSILTITGQNDQVNTKMESSSIAYQLEKDEIFDPSLVFVSSYRCFYYDTKKRIRKGKLYISFNELIFKCSGMPFVKCHLKFDKINDIQLSDNFEAMKKRNICIQGRDGKKYIFYKFYLPVKIVYGNLKRLFRKYEKSVLYAAPTSTTVSRETTQSTIVYEPQVKKMENQLSVKKRSSSTKTINESSKKPQLENSTEIALAKADVALKVCKFSSTIFSLLD
jgi:hypothetical protein